MFYFQLYVDVLDFYLKCRSVDALDHLQDWLKKIERTKLSKYDREEKKLYQKASGK